MSIPVGLPSLSFVNHRADFSGQSHIQPLLGVSFCGVRVVEVSALLPQVRIATSCPAVSDLLPLFKQLHSHSLWGSDIARRRAQPLTIPTPLLSSLPLPSCYLDI